MVTSLSHGLLVSNTNTRIFQSICGDHLHWSTIYDHSFTFSPLHLILFSTFFFCLLLLTTILLLIITIPHPSFGTHTSTRLAGLKIETGIELNKAGLLVPSRACLVLASSKWSHTLQQWFLLLLFLCLH